jgi:hypothetical protein
MNRDYQTLFPYTALFEIPPGVCETVLFRILRPNAAVGRAPRRRAEDLMA